MRIKTIAHALAAIGEPLGDKDLLLVILNGLDHDYDIVVSLIIYQMDEINLEKVQYLLLMHEQRLISKNFVDSSFVNFDSTVNVNVNVATHGGRFGNGSINNSRGGYMPCGGGFVNRGGRGRGQSSGHLVYFQLRGKPSHFLDKYFHWFNRKFSTSF